MHKLLLLPVAAAATAAIVAAPAIAAKPGGGNATNTVSIAAAPTTLTFSRAATISGQVTGAGNAGIRVTLEEDPFPFGDGFKNTTTTATTTATGSYTLAVVPGVNTHYRVSAKTKPDVTSSEVAVNVRPKVSLSVGDSTPKSGSLVRFSGFVLPGHDGKTIRIQKRTSSGGYKTVASTTLVATTAVNGVTRSKYAKRIRVRANGVYRASVTPGDGDHAAGVSSRRTLKVH
jgi:hypothetical protein